MTLSVYSIIICLFHSTKRPNTVSNMPTRRNSAKAASVRPTTCTTLSVYQDIQAVRTNSCLTYKVKDYCL